MAEQIASPRMYQGPRQEKQYRKQQRQLLQRQQEVYSIDEQQPSNALVLVRPKPSPATRVSTKNDKEVKSNFALIVLAYSLGIVGLGINAWFAWNRGSTLPDKVLLSSLGFIAEAIMFFLLSQAKTLLARRQLGSFLVACVVWSVLFVFALTNSLGFASFNLSEAATAKAERVTPAVFDAQRRLDTVSASRASECVKRGDKCRALEKDEQMALQALTEAHREVSAAADPQIASAAKLVSWVSLNRYNPSADDFAMLRLLLLTLLPQLGGLVLMVSFRPNVLKEG